jgi:hypothetical protein
MGGSIWSLGAGSENGERGEASAWRSVNTLTFYFPAVEITRFRVHVAFRVASPGLAIDVQTEYRKWEGGLFIHLGKSALCWNLD